MALGARFDQEAPDGVVRDLLGRPESGQATSELVQPLVDHFTEQGWQVAEDRTGSSGYRYVRIDHGQYTVEVSGERAARSGRATQLGLTVYSPCLPGRDAR